MRGSSVATLILCLCLSVPVSAQPPVSFSSFALAMDIMRIHLGPGQQVMALWLPLEVATSLKPVNVTEGQFGLDADVLRRHAVFVVQATVWDADHRAYYLSESQLGTMATVAAGDGRVLRPSVEPGPETSALLAGLKARIRANVELAHAEVLLFDNIDPEGASIVAPGGPGAIVFALASGLGLKAVSLKWNTPLRSVTAEGRRLTGATPSRAPIRIQGDVVPPTRIKDAKPEYPAAAIADRVQGTVTIEATIGPDGKVTNARVVGSIPALDQSALDAVRQWEFTPTLLNGIAVPVIMTVTVKFSLGG